MEANIWIDAVKNEPEVLGENYSVDVLTVREGNRFSVAWFTFDTKQWRETYSDKIINGVTHFQYIQKP